jgi:hypothetical protein
MKLTPDCDFSFDRGNRKPTLKNWFTFDFVLKGPSMLLIQGPSHPDKRIEKIVIQ